MTWDVGTCSFPVVATDRSTWSPAGTTSLKANFARRERVEKLTVLAGVGNRLKSLFFFFIFTWSNQYVKKKTHIIKSAVLTPSMAQSLQSAWSIAFITSHIPASSLSAHTHMVWQAWRESHTNMKWNSRHLGGPSARPFGACLLGWHENFNFLHQLRRDQWERAHRRVRRGSYS